MRILVLGAGFGGLELAARLSEELGDDLDLVLIDASESFVFGFSKLDLMFGRSTPPRAHHSYRDIDKPGVRFVQTTIRVIDPVAKRVETDAGPFEGDVVVVALGADLDATATPGLLEAGNEFYTVAGALALRERLAAFDAGHAVVAVVSSPIKCPPAPSEAALMLHDFLTQRGVRAACEISLVMPTPAPIPPAPPASEAVLSALAERGINWRPDTVVTGLDPERRVVRLHDGDELPYDLFLGVPTHRVPDVVATSGMAVDGWVPVDPRTLETSFDGVYAVGDVTSAGTPKAGAFAEGQALVVSSRILGRLGREPDPLTYEGQGVCYLEFGGDMVARVEVTVTPGRPPVGSIVGPTAALAREKEEFTESRIARWFGSSSGAH
jgi:sulfide:quinone oxidoreductase